jgi:hypothetical protein
MGVGSLVEEGVSGAEMGCSCGMEGVSDTIGFCDKSNAVLGGVWKKVWDR